MTTDDVIGSWARRSQHPWAIGNVSSAYGVLYSYAMPIARTLVHEGKQYFFLRDEAPSVATRRHLNRADLWCYKVLAIALPHSVDSKVYQSRVFETPDIFSIRATIDHQLVLHKQMLDKGAKSRKYHKEYFNDALMYLAKSEYLKELL